jgi:hypothetical protein
MNLFKILPTLSLALALIGGAVMFAPSTAKAGGFISNRALRADQIRHNSPPQQANPHTRGCSAITRCRG